MVNGEDRVKRNKRLDCLIDRLNIFLSEDENRHTNPVQFLDTAGKVIFEQPMQFNKATYASRNDKVGNGFYRGGKLIMEPMDFSKKNRISLEDLHTIVASIVFPEKFTKQRFNISEDDRQFVLKYMSQLPTESTYPPYSDDAGYRPAYCKFLMFGGEKGALPKNIRSFNKPGDAYGQMTDVAYFADFDNNIEFLLSATIYCNSDGILNDDKYDYATVALPFMKHLGEVIYEAEKKRVRKNKPDLSSLRFNYDKGQ